MMYSKVTKLRIEFDLPVLSNDEIVAVIKEAAIFGISEVAFTKINFLEHLDVLKLLVDVHKIPEITKVSLGVNMDQFTPKVQQGIEKVLDKGLSTLTLSCQQENLIVRGYAKSKNLPLKLVGPQVKCRVACAECNRIWLLTSGFIKSCYYSEGSYSVREFGVAEAIRLAERP